MNQSFLEKRNVVIDLLRAFTMAMMLMVNDFWSVSGIPHWMEHAAGTEDMLGFSDLVFPTFLFCVGLSIPYAIHNMRRKGRTEGDIIRHILSRSFALILMGAFICNYEEGIDPTIGYDSSGYSVMMTIGFFLVFCHYKSNGRIVKGMKLAGWIILLFLLVTSRSPQGALFYPYWWGILGLIGWAYLFCALVYALSKNQGTVFLVWMLLLIICLLCTPTADYSHFRGAQMLALSSPNIVDLTLSILRLGNASSHLLVMSGVFFSSQFVGQINGWPLRRRAFWYVTMAAMYAVAGWASHHVFIISKIIGTLPWIFYTLAIDVLLYMLFDALVTAGKEHWLKCLKCAGTATLTCYMIPYVLYPLISKTVGWDWSYAIPAPLGIVKCLTFSALCIFLTWGLGKLSVKLKI